MGGLAGWEGVVDWSAGWEGVVLDPQSNLLSTAAVVHALLTGRESSDH